MATMIPMMRVRDVEATLLWYESLGFVRLGVNQEEGSEMDWAYASYDGAEVMFNAGGTASAVQRREVDLYIVVTDIEASFAKLPPDAEVVEGIHETFYGMREFIVRDPNRYWLSFGQNPGAGAAGGEG